MFLVLSILLFFSAEIKSEAHQLLVNAQLVHPEVIINPGYQTKQNCTHCEVTDNGGIFLHPEVVQALQKAFIRFKNDGYRLTIFNGYESPSLQKKLRMQAPAGTEFYEDAHARGIAVDVSLTTISGTPLLMPSEFDEDTLTQFKSHQAAQQAQENASYLKKIMNEAGFIESESWWHFELPKMHNYPLLEWEPNSSAAIEIIAEAPIRSVE